MRRLLLDLTPLRESAPFRAVFLARTVSIVGLGFLLVAIPLQVYALTGSTTGVAVLTAFVGACAFVGTLVGGVLADRYDRRRLIVTARGVATLSATVLTVNALLPEPQLWVVFVSGAVDGLAAGVSGTALMAATPAIVAKDKLAAAGALVAMTTDIGAIAGPALGGLLIASGGVAANYGVCAVASLITTLLVARLPALPSPAIGKEPVWRQISGGFRFAAGHGVVGGALVVGFVAMAFTGWAVLLPAYSEVLGIGPAGFGLLYAAPAVGGLLGSLTSGWTGRVRATGHVVLGALALTCLGFVLAGAWAVPVLVFLGLLVHGAGRVVGDVLRYATVLGHTPDELRGRVAAVWTAQVTSGVAVGAVVAGGVAGVVGARWALLGYGVVGCAAALVLAVALPRLRAEVSP